MRLSRAQLGKICGIGHDTSMRGAGASLRDAINVTDYRRLRPLVTETAVSEYLANHPEGVTQWSRYCEDKRTSEGWGFSKGGDSWTVWRLSPPHFQRSDQQIFPSEIAACARYILLELDFWANLPSG
ncbi:MAG TPA: hypothetical protein VGY54_16740 [Polyangiaceae bacterium]|jgi:hypothetical protein|nr:hypothetical protein [Polyangiaceae bacterium]